MRRAGSVKGFMMARLRRARVTAATAVCCAAALISALVVPPAALAGPTAPAGCPAPAVGQISCAALITPGHEAMTNAAVAAAGSLPPGYGPVSLRDAYGLEASARTGGVGQTVAVVTAFDDASAQTDLATYRSEYGLPACGTGCFTKVNETGGTSYPPAGAEGWSLATAEAVDVISAVCPNCHVLLVEADSSDFADLGTAENEAVTLGANFVTNTWYTPEATAGTGESGYDTAYFDHPGVAITAPDGNGAGYGTFYPASSPDVIAVGGTTLTADPGTARGWSEAAWPQTSSGCSPYETKPSWQTDTGCSSRMLNDVSAVADASGSPIAAYDTGSDGWVETGGNIASSALIAAAYALAGTPAAGTNPASYLYAHTSQVNDITSGSDGTCAPAPSYFCTAGPGYDGPTGVGTPASAAALGAQAPDESLAGGPVTYDPDTGNQEIYAAGTPGTAFQISQTPAGKWSGLGNMGGDVSNRPSATFNPGSGNLEVYAKGSDGDVDEDAWVPAKSAWSGWKSLGGSAIQGSPSAIFDPLTGALEVYTTSSTGTIYEDYWTSSSAAWSGWKAMAGPTFSGGPEAVYDQASQSLQVWGTGNNGTEWMDAWTKANGWSGWQNMGGDIYDTPSVVYDPLDGSLEVYAHGPGDDVYADYQPAGGSWSGWHSSGGGAIEDVPSAAYDPQAASMDVFATGSTGTAFERSWTPAAGWSAWENLGGALSGGPFAAYNPAVHGMQVYGLGTNGDIYVNTETSAGTWSGWTDLGGTPGNL
jgi:hypothetical protein